MYFKCRKIIIIKNVCNINLSICARGQIKQSNLKIRNGSSKLSNLIKLFSVMLRKLALNIINNLLGIIQRCIFLFLITDEVQEHLSSTTFSVMIVC